MDRIRVVWIQGGINRRGGEKMCEIKERVIGNDCASVWRAGGEREGGGERDRERGREREEHIFIQTSGFSRACLCSAAHRSSSLFKLGGKRKENHTQASSSSFSCVIASCDSFFIFSVAFSFFFFLSSSSSSWGNIWCSILFIYLFFVSARSD